MYMYVYNKAKYDIINIILLTLIKYYMYIIYIYNIYAYIIYIYIPYSTAQVQVAVNTSQCSSLP